MWEELRFVDLESVWLVKSFLNYLLKLLIRRLGQVVGENRGALMSICCMVLEGRDGRIVTEERRGASEKRDRYVKCCICSWRQPRVGASGTGLHMV